MENDGRFEDNGPQDPHLLQDTIVTGLCPLGLLEETELPLSDDVQLSANDGGIACADIGEVGSSSPSPSSGRGSGLCLGAWGVESKLLDMSFFHILLLLRGMRGSRR